MNQCCTTHTQTHTFLSRCSFEFGHAILLGTHEVTGMVEHRGHGDSFLQRYEGFFDKGDVAGVSWNGTQARDRGGWGGARAGVGSVQHTSFPEAPAGRMLSWVS